MKKNLCFSLLLLLCADILFAQVNSPWKWSHPTPQGQSLRYVKVFSESTWYALGLSGTFMKTTNGGMNWFINHETMGEQGIFHYDIFSGWFFDMNTGLACGTYRTYGKISRTTDGGVSWDTISIGINRYFRGMHFINASTGFIAVSFGEYILKTTNGGLNWFSVTTGVLKPFFNIFALDENHIYCGSDASSLVYTTNGGTSWIDVVTGIGEPVALNDVFFKNADTGWVCGYGPVIRRTTNGGVNWTDVGNGLPQTSLNEITYDSNTLYVSGHELYVFRSSNDGTTWDSVTLTGNQYYSFNYYCLDKNAATIVTAGFDGLINSSTNSGANWAAHNYLGYASTLHDIWCDNMNSRVIAVGAPYPRPIIISTNGGANWQFDVAGNVGGIECWGLSMVNSNTGFVCGSSNKILKTVNGGADWDTSTVTGSLTDFTALEFVNASTGFVCGSSGRVFKTNNGGNSWSLLNTGTLSLLYSIDMVDANTGWIVGFTGTCRKTTNGGNSWIQQNPGSSSTLYKIKMIDANSGYLCGLSGTLMSTTNGGTNWETVSNPFSGSVLGFLSISFLDMNTGFVSASSGYTIRTSDGGNSWQVHNTSGGSLNAVFAKGYDSAWVCGSGAAVFKLYNSLVGMVTWQNEVPDRFTLSQNYPNPFNPSTSIKFGLPEAGRVSFRIYDITGRLVETVFNNVEMNPGTVTYVFDGKNYASGVYFYSLMVDGVTIGTKKMILVK